MQTKSLLISCIQELKLRPKRFFCCFIKQNLLFDACNICCCLILDYRDRYLPYSIAYYAPIRMPNTKMQAKILAIFFETLPPQTLEVTFSVKLVQQVITLYRTENLRNRENLRKLNEDVMHKRKFFKHSHEISLLQLTGQQFFYNIKCTLK